MKFNFLSIGSAFVIAGIIGYLFGLVLHPTITAILSFIQGIIVAAVMGFYHPFVEFD